METRSQIDTDCHLAVLKLWNKILKLRPNRKLRKSSVAKRIEHKALGFKNVVKQIFALKQMFLEILRVCKYVFVSFSD